MPLISWYIPLKVSRALQVLRTLVEVHEIPVDERYPDCVFVEDPVIVCGSTALITITGTVWSDHINGGGGGGRREDYFIKECSLANINSLKNFTKNIILAAEIFM